MLRRYRGAPYKYIYTTLSLSTKEAEIILPWSRSIKILSRVLGRVKYFFAGESAYLDRSETKPRKHRSPLYATAEKGKSARRQKVHSGRRAGSMARWTTVIASVSPRMFMPLSRLSFARTCENNSSRLFCLLGQIGRDDRALFGIAWTPLAVAESTTKPF